MMTAPPDRAKVPIVAPAGTEADQPLTGREVSPPSPSGSAPEVEHSAPVREVIHDIAWVCRADFAAVLRAAGPQRWDDPAAAGWTPVKNNPVRSVWRKRLGDRPYYLKVYHEHTLPARWKARWQGTAGEVEWNAGVYALRQGIPAVRPAGYAIVRGTRGRRCSLLVTEGVEPVYLLSEFWRMLEDDDDPPRRRRDKRYLIDLLAEMIALAHQTGFEHRDMHAANILVHPIAPGQYRTMFCDLQSARLGHPLDDQAVVRNLTQLHQWFRRHSAITDRLRFLRRYLRWRLEYECLSPCGRALGLDFDQLVAALADRSDRHARRLWARRDRRTLRNSRYFGRISLPRGWRGCVFLSAKRTSPASPASRLVLARPWWRTQLADPTRWTREIAQNACKRSHSALVARDTLDADGQRIDVIVKRPLARNFRRKLRQIFPPSRSMRGWRIGNALLNRDIPAARPLAVLEKRLGPFVLDSLLLTEAVPGARDLEAFLRAGPRDVTPARWWRQKTTLGRLVARRLRELHERGFVHRDCKAQNLLVVTEPELEVIWIDMDGLRAVRHPRPKDELRMLARLHVSLIDVPAVTRADRGRVLKAYLTRFGRDPDTWRTVWRRIGQLAERKLRALERRRAWKHKHYGRA